MKLYIFILYCITLISADEKWTMSAELMEGDEINNIRVQRLNKNVRFIKENKMLLTDYAIQYVKDDIIHLNGNTMMINNFDTLTCDSMIYWSKNDSIYARGNIRFVNNTDRGIIGDEMEIVYNDSIVERIKVINNAFAYNNLNLQIDKKGPYLFFRDEMSSKEMIAHYNGENISRLELLNMATTSYHIIDDSLLAGNNIVSGDTIVINFNDGNINRIQVKGGALGKFNPEINNTKIDTTILYGAEKIDYYIDNQLTFLLNGAFVEYQNTRLSAGKIIANWDTNIMDAFKQGNEYPEIQNKGEAPMTGNKMVFDLVAKHGRINQGRTSIDDGIYHGKEVFRDDPNIFHVQNSKFTSCDLENPHFYLGSHKMKLLPKDKVIAKPLWLYIFDIPIVGLPIAVFPNKGGKRHSGWIMPSFDSYERIGTGFKNLGYFWAPNDYMDQKILINFFDEEGINISSNLNYKKRYGNKWYNFQYDGNLNANLKKRLNNSNEILDLSNNKYSTEHQRISWRHNQKFDPTQRLAIKYEYVSSKDAYSNNQEINLQNRLKQNLSSSLNYNKNWKSSSISIGYNHFRDLSIENTPPNLAGYLNNDRYKSYKYLDGPKFNFRTGNKKIFGVGDKWYNSFTTSYTMKANFARKDYWLIKDVDNEFEWADKDTVKIKRGGIKHSVQMNAPQTFFNWLKINPSFSIREDWIFHYTHYNIDQEEEIEGFKRRLTWNSSVSANTKIYGLFPIVLGKLNAIRHVITPSINYNYQPDFSNTKWGKEFYFQDGNSSYDMFKNSYVGSTSKSKQQRITLSINNDFQAKLDGEKGTYKKSSFLTWNSSISYDAIKDSLNFSDIISNIRVKKITGGELFFISMAHNLYQYDQKNNITTNQLINIFDADYPRLTRINISTDMNIKLLGTKINDFMQTLPIDSIDNIEDEFYELEKGNKKQNNNIWESKLQFRYSTNWIYQQEKWDYKFTLKTINSINLTKKWSISYLADFNLKDKKITYHSLRIYRPLHCWEFSFNYWPKGGSAGFSLKINVMNPDLQDIKITSKSSNIGFGGF